jgi:hypothetical protein
MPATVPVAIALMAAAVVARLVARRTRVTPAVPTA